MHYDAYYSPGGGSPGNWEEIEGQSWRASTRGLCLSGTKTGVGGTQERGIEAVLSPRKPHTTLHRGECDSLSQETRSVCGK